MATNSSRVRIVEASPPYKKATQSLSSTSPALLKRKRVEQSKQDETEEPSSAQRLLAIHRRALQSLFFGNRNLAGSNCSTTLAASQKESVGQKEQRLLQLQRHRIALKADLEQCRQQNQSAGETVGDELRRKRNNAHLLVHRPYLHSHDRQHHQISIVKANSTTTTITTTTTSTTAQAALVDQELAERDLGQRMQLVRQRRKIAAAYRLAGISMVPCADENVLATRLDVTVEGRYVACYHAFFDLVVNDDAGDLYLRLVQHTLPPSIPLAAIVEETLGGIARVGPLQNEAEWETDQLVEKLRKCSNQLHQACYCYALRKESFSFLQSSATYKSRSYIVKQLQPTDTFKTIVFCLQLLSGMPSLQVELIYKDPMRPQPTGVSVRSTTGPSSANMNVTRNQAVSVDVVSDEEDGGLEDLIDTATMAFRRLPMRKAIKEVTDAMLEW